MLAKKLVKWEISKFLIVINTEYSTEYNRYKGKI